jgi:hypothetical protein
LPAAARKHVARPFPTSDDRRLQIWRRPAFWQSHEKAPIETLSQPSIRALIEMLVDGFYEPVFAVMPQGRCGMLQRNQSLVK